MPNHVHGIIIIHKPECTNALTNGSNCSDGSDVSDVETLHATSLQSTQSTQSTQSKNEFMANISPKSNSLSTIIRSYKSAVSKHAHHLGFDFAWQSRFYDHIIRNDKAYHQISEYIVNNPLKWQDDSLNPNIGL
jgi:REP element-mobilizing transposase RayT